MSLRLYPRSPARRRRVLAADGAAALCLVVFAVLGLATHHAVAKLANLGVGVVQGGTSVQRGFDSAAGAVSGVPVIGSQLAAGLTEAGAETGGRAVAAGRQGESDARRLATLLGWLIFLLPSSVLLQRFLPQRVREARRRGDAAAVLAVDAGDGRLRVVAERAAFSLPFAVLLRHTRDPLGDLEAGRYEALVAAALEDADL